MKFIQYNIVSVLLVLIAGYMIYADKPNWGWVIFAALIAHVAPSYIEESEDENG